MAVKCVGALIVLLGVLIVLVQMLQIGGNPNSSGLLFQDVPDLNGSGLWGGVVILAAGISAIWNKYAPCSLDSSSECFDRVGFLSFFNERPAFQALAALSMVCGLAIAGLQAWSLMRIWHWSRNMGPWSNCTEICQLVIAARPLMCVLGLLAVLTNGFLLCKKTHSQTLPSRFVDAGAVRFVASKTSTQSTV